MTHSTTRSTAASPDAASPDATSPDATSPDAASPDATSPDATGADPTVRRRWRRRIRTRLALASAGSAAAVLLAVGIGVGALTERADLRRVDAELEQRARTAPLVVRDQATLSDPRLRDLVGGFQVVTADGQLISGGSMPEAAIPVPARAGAGTVDVDGRSWRLLTVPVDGALVQYVAPLDPLEAAEREASGQLALGLALAAAAAAGVVGWFVGGRITRPLTRLRDEAAAVRAGADLERRVSVDHRVAEVGELAVAFNDTLARLGAEARRSSAALGASRGFAAAAAHELRTPLATVGAHLEILARHPDLPEARRAEVLRAATAEHGRLTQVIAGLRDLARSDLAEPSWFESCELGDLVAEAAAEAGETGGAGDHVTVRAPDGLEVLAWPAGIRLALTNLVANALRHAGLPGRDPTVVVTASPSGDGVVVTVDDDGPGVAPHLRERVLEPFERGASPTSGSGLGLAIARQQALLHGGSLQVGDSPLGGARVTLRLPRRAAPRVPVTSPP